MDSLTQAKNQIGSLIAEASSVGIVVTDRQTVDSLAAALSLHLILQDSGKNSQAISKKDPLVEHSFLVGIDQLGRNFSGMTKTLTVSFPYHDGDIEKVSYNIEGERLNVNLFAEEQGIRFTEKDIRYIRQGSSPQLVFTIGITNLSDIEDLVDPNVSKIINIDINPQNAMPGDVVLVNPSFSSYSEVIARLAADLNLQIEFDVAQNLLDGILYATQNFTSAKTSSLAFEMAGFLMQKGAVRKNLKEGVRSSQDTSLQMLGKQGGQKTGPKPSFQNPQKPLQNNKKFYNQPQNMQSFAPLQGKPLGDTQNKPFNPNPMNTPWQQPYNQAMNNQMTSQQLGNEEVSYPKPQSQFAPAAAQSNMPTPETYQMEDAQATQIPTEDEAPEDWFTPKVFKSTKNQG